MKDNQLPIPLINPIPVEKEYEFGFMVDGPVKCQPTGKIYVCTGGSDAP